MKGLWTWLSWYLLVLGLTATHAKPLNHLWYYSRRRLWTQSRRHFESHLCCPSKLCRAGHLSPEEETSKPVVSVAIFPKNTNFITKIHTGILESDDDNAINLDLQVNADPIFPDRILPQAVKESRQSGCSAHPDKADAPDKEDARHN